MAAPAAGSWTSRFTLGVRAESTAGLGEFSGGFRRDNPFPARVASDGSTLGDLREQVAAGEGYRSLRSLYEPAPPADLDGERYYAYLVAEGRYAWESGLALRGRLATREASGDTWDGGVLAARARNTYFIDELYVQYDRWDDWRTLSAGRQLYAVARGFVHDDYQTALRASADFGLAGRAPVIVRGAAAKIEGEHLDEDGAPRWDGEGLFDPDGTAYLAQATVGYPVSMLESVELSYVRFQERDGYFADLFNPFVADVAVVQAARSASERWIPEIAAQAAEACRLPGRRYVAPACFVDAMDYGLAVLAERQYDNLFASLDEGAFAGGRSFLNYAVLEGDKYVGPVLVSGAVVGEWGRVTLEGAAAPVRALGLPGRVDFATRGLLLYGSAEIAPGDVRLRAHYLFSSGENRQFLSLNDGDRYDSFLGVRPYVRLTNIFFSGGISENLRTGSIAPSGYYGHGVWAPVADVEWSPLKPLTLVLTGAYLHSQQAPVAVEGLADRGGAYGWEADLMVFYRAADWLRLSAEGDYFAPGDFFVDMPRVWKAAAGVDFVFDAGAR